jgi:hypothetical protein
VARLEGQRAKGLGGAARQGGRRAREVGARLGRGAGVRGRAAEGTLGV